ncbi:uncharacterized protein [Chelonus insularis]|uniref:uncharacterized protein n=1 Tax=Chelonus insularis TaxID=460826 RepID=UPI001588E973|nr:uncharacterized protein LOC118065292 [Chelonus insularis]
MCRPLEKDQKKEWHKPDEKPMTVARPAKNAAISKWLKDNKLHRWYQPPYFLDLSPCDYGCFHSPKRTMGGMEYEGINSLKEALDKEMKTGNASGKNRAVEKLPECWKQCIERFCQIT